MPKQPRANYLNIYAEPSASSQVICAAKHGRALELIESIPYWYLIQLDLCRGYVSKGEVDKFEEDLTDLEKLAANQVKIHVIDGVVCLNIYKFPYFIDLGRLNELPIGKENAKTIRQILNDRGGRDNITPEIKENCSLD